MTMKELPPNEAKIKAARPKVVYHGPAKLGERQVMCAVLDDGRRGYVQRSLQQAIGMTGQNRVMQFRSFCAEIAPSALKYMEKSGYAIEVSMPHGGVGIWVGAGILTDLTTGVVDAALSGTLSKHRSHLVQPCMQIVKALGKVGETALIDEATGYQYHREPDALQDLFSKLLRAEVADWEQRFHPEFYAALCKLFGFQYGNKHRALPPIIGQITRKWVYESVFPVELVQEIKSRKKSEKMHQWLQDGGLKELERQIDAVKFIAKSSVDYKDFEANCSNAFYRKGQQIMMAFPHAGGSA